MSLFDHQALCGWMGEDAARAAYEKNRASFGDFRIRGGRDLSAGVTVKLWEAAQKVLGKHIKSYKQEIGDCVSFGAANAVMYLTVSEIALGTANWEFHEVYQPWIYGTSRCDIGGQHDYSDGSTGAWAAKAVKQLGILFYDDEGVPAYSGNVAKEWGYSGPPKKFYPVAKDNPVKTVAQISSFDDVVEAVGNGYACTIASDVGFEGDGNMQGRIQDGRCWGVRGGSWGHQMSIIAVDTNGSRPAAFIMNSWGPSCWSEQPDGAPKGGFWADAKYITEIVQQGDSYAFSAFDGWPGREIDFSIV
jgi:hypothetical protein